MPDILRRLGREVLVVDGAMGTMLQRAGMPSGQCPEELNVTNPEMVLDVHRAYVTVGAECISTNTFGGTRNKLAEYGLGDRVEELNRAAVRLARASGAQHILADVGPTGLVMQPLGAASFAEVFDLFVEQISALVAEGPDALAFETFTDLAEIRCALLAARSLTDLPLIASMTFGASGRTELSATDPETAAVVLEACGASAVGMNCGLGPEQMLPLVEAMAAATTLPLVVQPNAGLPTLVGGRTHFPGTPAEMGEYAARFAALGAGLVGSCCGSSPSFTGAILDEAKGVALPEGRVRHTGVALASARRTVRVGGGRPLAIIGERINPTGKKTLADSLRAGSMEIVRSLAADQTAKGAALLDVNVGAAGVDAPVVLPRAVVALAGMTDVPLVIDTTDPIALEAALAAYPGRALINSVNGGADSMASVLPLARRFGAAVVVLALDDEGIPLTAEGRVAIVERVRAAAHREGLTDADLIVDCLVMTAASDPGAASTTLEALRRVHDLGLATVLGVSNVSHGLPGRPELNATMLAMAVEAGLDAAIYDPGAERPAATEAARDVLTGTDKQAARWIASRVAPASAPVEVPEGPAPALALAIAVERGDADGAPRLVEELLATGLDPRDVIATVLTPAIRRLGEGYGRGEVFLPQMMVAADAMKAAVARVRMHLPADEHGSAGRVVFATVKGDVHSIGKDICVSLLESQGFVVDDLGVDVDMDRVLDAASGADAVCLSALMTTTLPAMERTVSALKSGEPDRPVLVGGAVVTAAYAGEIGADGYAADAPGCVEAVRGLIDGSRR